MAVLSPFRQESLYIFGERRTDKTSSSKFQGIETPSQVRSLSEGSVGGREISALVINFVSHPSSLMVSFPPFQSDGQLTVLGCPGPGFAPSLRLRAPPQMPSLVVCPERSTLHFIFVTVSRVQALICPPKVRGS